MSKALKNDLYSSLDGYYDYGCNYDYEECYRKQDEDENSEKLRDSRERIKKSYNEVIL